MHVHPSTWSMPHVREAHRHRTVTILLAPMRCTQYGYVPLHIAAGAYWQLDEMEGYDSVRMVATVELLISKGGADVNARDSLVGLHTCTALGCMLPPSFLRVTPMLAQLA